MDRADLEGRSATLRLLRMTCTEIEITAEWVRHLLRDQHPDLADHPLTSIRLWPDRPGWFDGLPCLSRWSVRGAFA